MLPLPVMLILSTPVAQTPLFNPHPGDRFRDQLLARGLERIESRSPATVTSAEEAGRLLPVTGFRWPISPASSRSIS